MLDLQFAAGAGTPFQYVFDRSAAVGLDRGQHLEVSLPAAHSKMSLLSDQLRARFLPALAEPLPRARRALVMYVHVVRDASTFRAVPRVEALRPGSGTAIPGLALAGAWTATGWPATIEGTVRSGLAATRHVLSEPAPLPVASEPALA